MLRIIYASRARKLREKVLCLDDFEPMARRKLPRPVMTYIEAGSERAASQRDNRAAFDEYGFIPSALIDVSERSTATLLMGTSYSAPFGIAPMGMACLASFRGDLAMAHAARAANVPMVLSGASLTRVEDIVRANPDVWFQAYLSGDKAHTDGLLDRLENAGIGTLVVTVDIPVAANRDTFRRGGFSAPLRPGVRLMWEGVSRPCWLAATLGRTLLTDGMPHFENSGAGRGEPILSPSAVRSIAMRDRFSWKDIETIRSRWAGRLVIKGLINPDDVRRARDAGADGAILSNHGGRQLDGVVSPMRVLASGVSAAKGMPVMMDGGIRRGTDIMKALALGAAFVFVGRPFLYAIAVAGGEGITHAITLLKNEIQLDMALLGICDPAALSKTHLWWEPDVKCRDAR